MIKIKEECVGNCFRKLFIAVIYLFMLLLVSPYFITLDKKVSLLFLAVFLYLYSNREEGSTEVKILFAFGVWTVFTHMVGTDIFVRENTDMIFCYCAMYVFVAVGAMLGPDKRLRFLDFAAIPYCFYFTVVGIVCVYSVIFQEAVFNPITKGCISNFGSTVPRIIILEENPNTMAYFFFFSIMFLIYLFLRYKKPVVRVIIIPALIVNYITAVFTFSRNIRLCISLCAALMLVMIVLKYCSSLKRIGKVFIIAAVLCMSFLVIYKSFDLSAQIMGGISQRVLDSEKSSVESEENVAALNLRSDNGFAVSQENLLAINLQSDYSYVELKEDVVASPERLGLYEEERKVFQDTGRLPIYKAAFETLAEKPSTLLIGNVYAMQFTNQQRYENDVESGKAQLSDYRFVTMAHHHNVLIQTLMYLGIPGLVLMLAFLFLLAAKSIRLFFAESVPVPVKILVISLCGGCLYNMFETSIYYKVDYCSFVFLLIAGIVIAFHDEMKKIRP